MHLQGFKKPLLIKNVVWIFLVLLFFLIFNFRLRDVDKNKLGPVLSADVFAGLSRLDIL